MKLSKSENFSVNKEGSFFWAGLYFLSRETTAPPQANEGPYDYVHGALSIRFLLKNCLHNSQAPPTKMLSKEFHELSIVSNLRIGIKISGPIFFNIFCLNAKKSS